jgi:hypothetical protein
MLRIARCGYKERHSINVTKSQLTDVKKNYNKGKHAIEICIEKHSEAIQKLH